MFTETHPTTRTVPGPRPGTRRLRAVLTLTAAAVTAALAVGLSSTGTAAAAARPPAAKISSAGSGLPWASGTWLAGDSPAAAAAFGAWRGRPLDVIDEWSNRATWQDIVNPKWLYSQWQGSPYTMAFGVAMLPSAVPGVSLAACAAGAYNAYWKQFGTVITAYGLGKSIIRLGWEFNGNWYPWAATDPATWAHCWQQIVTAARTTAPALVWN